MLRAGLAARPDHRVHLYYGVRNGAEHAFRQELEELAQQHPNLHLEVAYSRPRPEDLAGGHFHHRGHVDIELLRKTLPIGRHRFYVCGPPPMMATLIPALLAWGVPHADLHHEAFGPASVPLAEGVPTTTLSAPIDVLFRTSGRTLSWVGTEGNLLDLAERHGVSVSSGCRSGSCGSCEVRVLSGVVRYAQQPDYEIAPGGCLLCVGTPESTLELEA
jgi:ferredoxin-NADP reductase